MDNLYRFLNTPPYHNDSTVIYHCTSSYPCKEEHLFLNEILYLKEKFMTVGFSNHSLNTDADIVALAFGAEWIEHHFTSDDLIIYSDTCVSLKPTEFKNMVHDLKNIIPALEYKKRITAEEIKNAKKLKNND